MARSRKRYDIYSQPGLFDFDDRPTPDGAEWKPGDVVAGGGLFDLGATEESPLPEMVKPEDTALRFMSFGSGSSGNAAYIGTDKFGILIDAGVDPVKIEEQLLRNGINMIQVVGVLLTHDHSDHMGYAYKLLRNNRHMALFCTPRTLNGLLRRHGISRRVKDYHKPIYKEMPFTVKDFSITPFEVSHDGSDNVGYFIEYRHHRFVVGTDMGFIAERADHYMRRATTLMIESDYDADMLTRGRYPEYLKSRIRAEKGHLDNAQVAEFLRSAWSPAMTHVFLCHLSKDNNTPETAGDSARQALMEAGAQKVGHGSETIDERDAPVQLYALPRFDPSPFFLIR